MKKDKLISGRKKIGKGQITGNRGEMFVGFLLSKFCLVRPAANGTDVGVDLYCEALMDETPHSHFWVQVKTRRGKMAKSKTFRKQDLEYWSRQPIPVFIFFVSDDAMDFNHFRINVISLTEKFNEEPSLPNKKSKLACDLTISTQDELKRFVFNEVPKTVSRMYIREGVIFHTRRNVYDEYARSYESRGIHKYTTKIMKNIGRSSALLMKDIISSGKDDLNIWRKQLEKILETFFPRWGNYDFHLATGLSKEKDKEYAGALPYFEKALENIDSDSRFKEYSESPRRLITAKIELCRSKIEK